MSIRISYNQGSQLGKQVADAVDATIKAQDALRRADAAVTAAQNGATWGALAGEVGGGITDTDAQNLWTILRNAKTTMDGGAISELARLDRS